MSKSSLHYYQNNTAAADIRAIVAFFGSAKPLLVR